MTVHGPSCLFLSDAHLSPERPAKVARFLDFLAGTARRYGALYILGDLFDFIAGPQHLGDAGFRPILEAFRKASDAGLRVAFIPGNRDYTLGSGFSRATGLELLPPRAEVRLGGLRVFLEHGDLLFNRNPRYTAYRRVAGTRGAQRLWAALPEAIVVRFAAGLRSVSRRDTPPAPFRTGADLLDAAGPAFRRGADLVICGHLHRAADLRAEVEGKERRLIVLGEWEPERNYACYEKGEFRLT